MVKKTLQITSAVAAVAILATSTAHAASNRSLEQRLEALEKQLQNLNSTAIVKLPASPTFQTADGKTKFAFDGYVQADKTFYNNDLQDRADHSKIRRARLGVKGKTGDYFYRFQVGFGNNVTKITDAYVGYKLNDKAKVRVGQFKEAFSMEELKSSSDLTFLERSQVNAFAPHRSIGAEFKYVDDNWSFQTGVFGENADKTQSSDETVSSTTRLTYTPINNGNHVWHLGGSYRYSEPTGSSYSALSFKEATYEGSRGATTSVADISTSTTATANVNKVNQIGLEFAYFVNNLLLEGEYITTTLDRDNLTAPNSNITYEANYAQASYAFNGSLYKYCPYSGLVKRKVEPNSKLGVWEVALRTSKVNLNEEALARGKAVNTTVGVNYYPNNNVKLSANYINVNTDMYADNSNNINSQKSNSPEILAVRAQFKF